jgi:hypothetical protein
VRTWQAEILAWHATNGCSNRLTEAINLLSKMIKPVGHGFRNFPTIGDGYCCTAASPGRFTEPRNCKATLRAGWRRARKHHAA